MSSEETAGAGSSRSEVRSEIEEKLRRVRSFLSRNRYDGAVFARKDNFAWLTCGGRSEVVVRSETGTGILLVTATGLSLVAYPMDGPRIMEEIFEGIPVEYHQAEWYESTLEEKVAELIEGKRFISDFPVGAADHSPGELSALHYPLSALEMARLRALGERTEQILRSIADTIAPGMTENEVGGLLASQYAQAGILCDVLLVGSDERIGKYRHPIPTDKKIGRLALLHSAVQQWGLHANVTRMVSFAEVDEELRARYDAASEVEATAISMCRPGTKFEEILATQKRVLVERGYPDDWRFHYLGGVTGYVVADPTLCMNPTAVVESNQAYDWFITITGVKVEELSVNTGDDVAVFSVTGGWPTRRYSAAGRSFELPDILCR